MTALPLAAAAGDVVEARAAVTPAGSTQLLGQVLLTIFLVLLAFAIGLLVGGYTMERGETTRLKMELRARSREAALTRLTVAELKILVAATGVQPGSANKPLMIDYLVMHGERQLARSKVAGNATQVS